jgi:uncharacterized protein YnzC (UPF0291/DUF896 family)
MSQYRKDRQETFRKYVTDGQSVTNQIKEGGHDVTNDKRPLRQWWMKNHRMFQKGVGMSLE